MSCLILKQRSRVACVLNETFGCMRTWLDQPHMYVRGGCRGLFHCNGERTPCGSFLSSAFTTCRCSSLKHRLKRRPAKLHRRWGEYGATPLALRRSMQPRLTPALARCVLAHSHGQWGEDRALLTLLLSLAYAQRTFVEIGAFDGIEFSNSLALEKCFGYTGALVEANPGSWDLLRKNRGCGSSVACLHAGVCSPAGEMVITARPQEIAGNPEDMSAAYLVKWKRFNCK